MCVYCILICQYYKSHSSLGIYHLHKYLNHVHQQYQYVSLLYIYCKRSIKLSDTQGLLTLLIVFITTRINHCHVNHDYYIQYYFFSNSHSYLYPLEKTNFTISIRIKSTKIKHKSSEGINYNFGELYSPYCFMWMNTATFMQQMCNNLNVKKQQHYYIMIIFNVWQIVMEALTILAN